MSLFYQELGRGNPMIILHGLYGSSDNWLAIAKYFAEKYHVYIPDLRNHGNSEHFSELNYEVLLDDLLVFCNEHNIQKAVILGHSMGGKLAMSFALYFPYMVEKLIVVDISPKSYVHDDSFTEHCKQHIEIIDALKNLHPENIKSRTDADKKLSEHIKSKRIRQFLLKNLKRNKNGSYSWKFNLESIKQNLRVIMGPVVSTANDSSSPVPALFIKGAQSNYIQASEEPLLQKIFPASQIKVIENAGHWVHAEQTGRFLSVVSDFLNS